MGLNIKNERVHALAKRAAALTGQTQTSAIETALETMLAGMDDGPRTSLARRADVDALLVDVDRRLAGHPLLSTAELYDDAGLPA